MARIRNFEIEPGPFAFPGQQRTGQTLSNDEERSGHDSGGERGPHADYNLAFRIRAASNAESAVAAVTVKCPIFRPGRGSRLP